MKRTLLFILLLFVIVQPVFGSSSGFSKGYVVVTFDDGRDGTLAYAAPILQQDGIKATIFVYTESLSQSWQGFLNLEGALRLQNAYGWQFEGHSETHPDMNHLTSNQMTTEVTDSKATLQQDGFKPVGSFAYPYDTGWDNATVLSQIKQQYVAARRADNFGSTPVSYDPTRQLGPVACNVCPPDRYQLQGNVITNQTSVQTVTSYLDQAISSHTLLILTFHQIVKTQPQQYEYSSQDLKTVMDYASAKIQSGSLESVYFSDAIQLLFGVSSFPASCWLVCTLQTIYGNIVGIGATVGVVWAIILVRWNRKKKPLDPSLA